jgi:hypothetical protein
MTNLNDLEDTSPRGADVPFSPIFQCPDEVLGDPEMTREEKRALLASWASDARAVPGLPSMRRLEDGSLIDVEEILQALEALDAASDPEPLTTPLWRTPPQRRTRPSLRNWARIIRDRRRDDDDDPPPSPVMAAVPPKPGSGGAFAYPEPALA